MTRFLVLFAFLVLMSSSAWALDELAERYVRLALELGEYDSDYVDAYLGPPQWREKARANLRPKQKLTADIADTKTTIERHEENLSKFREDEQIMASRFDRDIDRFKELKGLN